MPKATTLKTPRETPAHIQWLQALDKLQSPQVPEKPKEGEEGYVPPKPGEKGWEETLKQKQPEYQVLPHWSG